MANNNGNNNHSNGSPLFLQQFLKHPLQVGSIIPSSRFLERRIVEAAGIDTASLVVELGPGTGGTTRALLRAMPQSSRLLTIEINPDLHAMVSHISDDRLTSHLGSACDIASILSLHDLGEPDVVISGIPFSTMSRELGTRIIEAVSTVLSPEGRFIAYQARDRVATLCRPIMGTEQAATEFFNIPPMRVYQWQKRTPAEPA